MYHFSGPGTAEAGVPNRKPMPLADAHELEPETYDGACRLVPTGPAGNDGGS
jgi:hypothetical protein